MRNPSLFDLRHASKFRSIVLSFFMVFIASPSFSQLKVLSSGNVNIGGYHYANTSKINLYGYDVSTIYSIGEYSSGGGHAVKSQVNRGDAIAYSAMQTYFGTTFMVYGNGDVWNYNSIYTSDARIKENIHPIDDALEKLRKLNGVSYNYIGRNDKGRKQLGMLAQDVEKVFPEIVYETDSGVKGIAYVQLIPVIIEALKIYQDEVDDLKAELALLKSSDSQKSAVISTGSMAAGTETATLAQNVPNPFSTSTRIGIFLPQTVNIARLYVYNMQGAQIRSFNINDRGNTHITIEGYSLEAGMYLYTLIADGKEVDTKKMILTK